MAQCENGSLDNGQFRVALICQHFYPEMVSTGMLMTELAEGLAGKGHALRAYCARPAYGEHAGKKLPRRERYGGVEIVRLPSLGDPRGGLISRGLFGLAYLAVTFCYLVRDRKRLAGVITTTNPPFIGLAATGLRLLAGIPYVTIVHDVYPEIAVRLGAVPERSPLTWLWQAVTRLIFRRSRRLVVIGRDMAQIVCGKLGGVPNGKVELIPNWSDERRVKPVPAGRNRFVQAHDLQDRFVVQYSGRMGRTHNLEPLLEAAALLHDEPVLLQLIGDGAKREKLRSLARDKGLRNVQFLPYQPFEHLDEVLSAPDLAVVCLDRRFTGLSVPSKSYGIMAGGRPILGFLDPHSEIARAIREHECGIVLPQADGRQVAGIVRRLMSDRHELRRMGRNGRRAFLQKYTLSHAVERYDRLLRQCFYGKRNLSAKPALVAVGGERRHREGRWSFPLQFSERKLLLATVDFLLLIGALSVAITLRRDLIAPEAIFRRFPIWALTLAIAWLGSSLLFEIYDVRLACRALRSAWQAGLAALLSCGAYCLIPYVTPGLPQRRLMLGVFPTLAVMGIGLWRFAYAHVFVQPGFTCRALIVGAGRAGQTIAEAIASAAHEQEVRAPDLGYRVLGFVDDDPSKQGQNVAGAPVLGTRHELLAVARALQPDEIILAVTDAHSMHGDLFASLLALQERGIPLTPMADLYECLTGKVPVEHAGRDLRVVLPTRRSPGYRLYLGLFRLLELLLAVLGCLFLLLLMPPVWLANRLTDPGDLFYRQERVGWRGHRFQVFKFRSMVMNAEDGRGAVWASEKDARVTPVGRLLRRTRLDELPQCWNVLKGEMSIVGPRPERPHFVRCLSRQIPFYSVRHSVRPGITGWAQVEYRYGASVKDALTKLEYDLYYIKNRSPYLDLKILVMTARVMFGLKGR